MAGAGNKTDTSMKFRIRVSDEVTHAPHAHKPYEARCGRVKLVGRTDGDGGIDLAVPRAAKEVRVFVWVDDSPGGRKEYAIRLGPAPN